MSIVEWHDGYLERKAKRKKYLNEQYPNNKIQSIDIQHLRKIGYAIGMGSTESKKEYIDRIIKMQAKENPIIKCGENGIYYINIRCILIGYIICKG